MAAAEHSWLEKERLIVEALARLPLASEEARSEIHIFAIELIGRYPRDFDDREKTGWDNPQNPATRSTTKKELDKIKALSHKLSEAIQFAHKPTHELLGLLPHPDISLADGLITYLTALYDLARLADISRVPTDLGSPKKKTPAAVAALLAQHFLKVTGTRPTIITPPGGGKAHGQYLELVTAVFGALGIAASPESQARAAVTAMRAVKEKGSPKCLP